MSTTVQVMHRGATEFVDAEFTASVNLDAQPVHFSFDDGETWLAGSWTGAIGMTRTARVLVAVDSVIPVEGFYAVLVRVTDTPEIPIRQAGAIEIR